MCFNIIIIELSAVQGTKGTRVQATLEAGLLQSDHTQTSNSEILPTPQSANNTGCCIIMLKTLSNIMYSEHHNDIWWWKGLGRAAENSRHTSLLLSQHPPKRHRELQLEILSDAPGWLPASTVYHDII